MLIVITLKKRDTWMNIVTGIDIVDASLHTEDVFEVIATKHVVDRVLEQGEV